jgi:PAS domain S-box-containing protein
VTCGAPDAFGEALRDALPDLAAPIAEAAAEVTRAQARRDEFLENVPVGVYRSTPDGRILYANPPLADLFGVESVEALDDLDLNDPGIAQDDRTAFKEKVEREGQIVQNETVWTRPDGGEVHVLESARVVRDEDGAVRYYEGVVEDITERKRAEEELRAEKHFIDSALNSLPGAFYLIDQSFRFRRWNQQLEEVTGYTSEEIRNTTPLDLIVEADRERVAERAEAAFKEGAAAVEARVRTREGDTIPLYLTAARVHIQDTLYIVGMGIDISERVAIEEALREAKEEAEEMNRLKSVFLANMSHEIRTPLTSILGFADVLGEEVDGEARHVVEMIRQSGHRLKETLTSVLELARLERESAEVSTERCDLVGRVQETLDLMQPQIESNGLDLQVRTPSAPVVLQADPRVLHRVLTNLVANAIKFTEEGAIRVTVERAGDEAVLRVSDTGIGISDEFLDQIFEEFRQESEGLTRAHEGSGLGLTITRRLVELMGGAIEAESTKGEGSTFTVRLPLDDAEEDPPDAEASPA